MRDNVHRVSAKSIKPKKVVVNVESNLKACIKKKQQKTRQHAAKAFIGMKT